MHELNHKTKKEFQKGTAKKRIAKFLGFSTITLKTESPVRMQVSSTGDINDHFTKVEAMKGISNKIGYPIVTRKKCRDEHVRICDIKGKESKTILPPENTTTLNFPVDKKMNEKDFLVKLLDYLLPGENLPTKEAEYVYVNGKCVGSRFSNETIKALEEIYDGYKKWLEYKNNQ